MSKDHEPLFTINGQAPTMGVADHNVGKNGVLDSIKSDMANKVQHKYEFRGGHVPEATQHMGILVDQQSREMQDHLVYLEEISGRRVDSFTIEDLSKKEGVLIAPYIKTSKAVEHLKPTGANIWGLDEYLVDDLKNKAWFHQQVALADVPDFETPEFRICKTCDVANTAWEVLKESEKSYAQNGITNYEPFGVMIRAAASDGGYGSAIVRLLEGRVHILPDGEFDPDRETYDNTSVGWAKALHLAQNHFNSEMDSKKEDRVVVSRLIDLADSPGLSVVVLQGEVFSLGWNGQLKVNNGSACVGTSKYNPQNDYLLWYMNTYEHRTATAFGNFLRHVSTDRGLDFSHSTGIANIDIMIPGASEVAYQNKLLKKGFVKDPHRPTIAECNPRFTNLTDGILAIARIQSMPQTIATMRDILSDGILTVDRYAVPNNLSVSDMRNVVKSVDSKFIPQGSRVVLRMPTKPNAGLIFYGNIEAIKHSLDQAVAIV